MKGILDKYQLNPTNCVFLGNIGYNTIATEKLGINSYQVKKRSDAVDILKKLNKQKTLYFFKLTLIRNSPLGFCVAFIKFTGKTC